MYLYSDYVHSYCSSRRMGAGHTIIGTGHRGMMNGGQTIVLKHPQKSTASGGMQTSSSGGAQASSSTGTQASSSGGKGTGLSPSPYGTQSPMNPGNMASQGFTPCPAPWPILDAGTQQTWKTEPQETTGTQFEGETAAENIDLRFHRRGSAESVYGGDSSWDLIPDFIGLELNRRRRSAEPVFGGDPSWTPAPEFMGSPGLNQNRRAEPVFGGDPSRNMTPESIGSYGLNRSRSGEPIFGTDPAWNVAPESIGAHGSIRNRSVESIYKTDPIWTIPPEQFEAHTLNRKRSPVSIFGKVLPSWHAASGYKSSPGLKRKAASTHDAISAPTSVMGQGWESCMPGPSRLSGSCGKYTSYSDPLEPVRTAPKLKLIPADPTNHVNMINSMQRGIPVPSHRVVRNVSTSARWEDGLADVDEDDTGDEKNRALKRYKRNHDLMKAIMSDHIIPPGNVMTTERLDMLRTQVKELAERQEAKEFETIEIVQQHEAKLKAIAAAEERFNLQLAKWSLRVNEERVLALSDTFYEELKEKEEEKRFKDLENSEAARRAAAADSLASLARSVSPGAAVATSVSPATVVQSAVQPRPASAPVVASLIQINNDQYLCMGRNIARAVPIATSVIRSNAAKEPAGSNTTAVEQPK